MSTFAERLKSQVAESKAEKERARKKPAGKQESAPVEPKVEPEQPGSSEEASETNAHSEAATPAQPVDARKGNLAKPQISMYLFPTDLQNISVIRERLANAGHEFVSRSHIMKVALRIAMKTNVSDLVEAFQRVEAEDKRFRKR